MNLIPSIKVCLNSSFNFLLKGGGREIEYIETDIFHPCKTTR